MTQIATGDRISRLAGKLNEGGYDAFFAWHPVSMTYLQGFGEAGHERFLTLAVRSTGEVVMICPSLSETQARRSGIADVRSWRDGEDPLALFAQLAEEWGIKTGILAVDNDLPAHMLLSMQEVLPAALFKPGQEFLSSLMRVKSSDELELMEKAAAIADDSYAAGRAAIKSGATEREVAQALLTEMRRLGGTNPWAIVAAGKNGAEPHHESDDTPIQNGDVIVLDFGCQFGGYCSDITRCVSCGEASEEARNVYEIVLRAHDAARNAVAPGVTGSEVDSAARKVIENAGYGEFFVHRTGHGIGMNGHEAPNIVNSNNSPLEVGNCFSIEPGIYLPGKFGVRLENIYTVDENGARSFNAQISATLEQA